MSWYIRKSLWRKTCEKRDEIWSLVPARDSSNERLRNRVEMTTKGEDKIWRSWIAVLANTSSRGWYPRPETWSTSSPSQCSWIFRCHKTDTSWPVLFWGHPSCDSERWLSAIFMRDKWEKCRPASCFQIAVSVIRHLSMFTSASLWRPDPHIPFHWRSFPPCTSTITESGH